MSQNLAVPVLPGMTTPHQRLLFHKVAPDAFRAVFALEEYVHSTGLAASLLHLVRLRSSYLNGCAYCIDMHSKDARADGETEQRIYAVPVWRETPFFSPRERAALAFTEAVTMISREGVPDDVYAEARVHFEEAELIKLTVAISAINAWNRLSITFRSEVGGYQPGQLRGLTR
jgi:AhpD family alkylhydroperoxidase